MLVQTQIIQQALGQAQVVVAQVEQVRDKVVQVLAEMVDLEQQVQLREHLLIMHQAEEVAVEIIMDPRMEQQVLVVAQMEEKAADTLQHQVQQIQVVVLADQEMEAQVTGGLE
jgi:hypothetical protein